MELEIAGFGIKLGHYVTYASSIPINERHNNLELESFKISEGTNALQTYYEKMHRCFGSIEICVRSIMGSDMEGYFDNRGVFKNPTSILNGNYRGISTLLHSFSAIIAQNEFGKTHLGIAALPAMSNIMKKFLNDKPGALEEKKDAV